MKPLLGKWALVTGSSRGIGQQIAMGLSQEGCNVILHARTPKHLNNTRKLLESYETQTSIVAGDLATDAGVKAVIEGVMATSIPLDILYNNAAIQNEWQPVWEIPKSVWQEVFQVNVYALISICNALAPGMVERGYGRIINLTSGIKDTPALAPYGVSKAAIDKYSQELACDCNGTNVLVNYLDPGWLRTDLGGPNAMFEVETVLPGALVPALLEDNGPTGKFFSAQDFKYLG